MARHYTPWGMLGACGVIIIGGVAGGMSAATRLRRLEEDADITVLERSGHVSFANCGLPYHVGGVIGALLAAAPDPGLAPSALRPRRPGAPRGERIDRGRHVVDRARPRGRATEDLPYDALVVSPGARPVRPPIPGIERALSLRDIEDTDALVAATGAPAPRPSSAAGSSGSSRREPRPPRARRHSRRGRRPGDGPARPRDGRPGARPHPCPGVDLRLSSASRPSAPMMSRSSAGEPSPADVVVAAIGVRPDTALAEQAGLAIGPPRRHRRRRPLPHERPAVFAVGDAVEKRRRRRRLRHARPPRNTANLQGRRAADVIAGLAAHDRPVLGTAIVGVFGLQAASTGWNEKRLAPPAARTGSSTPTRRPTRRYYPGAERHVPQAARRPRRPTRSSAPRGSARRASTSASTSSPPRCSGGLTASALAELELAYAPPFSSAKDPVNMLGHVADNLRRGTTRSIQWHELDEAVADGAVVVDIRDAAERTAAGVIPGGPPHPPRQLRDRIGEIPTDLSSSTAPSASAGTRPPGSSPSTAGTTSATSTAASAPGSRARGQARTRCRSSSAPRTPQGSGAAAATVSSAGRGAPSTARLLTCASSTATGRPADDATRSSGSSRMAASWARRRPR